MKLLIALLCSVFGALCWGASSQSGASLPEPVPCPSATELLPQHLYGRWRADFSEPGKKIVAGTAVLLFEQDPDFPQGVRGSIIRDEGKALVSGDADEGEFALDESVDGVNISASWTGSVVPDTCGREIQGRRSDVVQKTELDFVLRKWPENSP